MSRAQRSLLLPTAALAGAFLSAAGACPTGPVSFCEGQIRAQCELFFRCCEDSERIAAINAILPYVNSEGECYDRLAPICKASGAAQEDSIALGRLKFNGDRASECLAAFNTARDTCDRGASAAIAACEEVVEGLVEDGDECASNAECGRGGECRINNDAPDVNEDEGALEGECNGPRLVGEECGNAPCQRGLVCRVFPTGAAECEEAPADGDDCVDGECGTGLFCSVNNTCEALKDDGEACEDSFECKTFTCEDGECGNGTCNGI